MASTPPTEEAFLREVDEELRREQLQTVAKRYGMIALVVVGLFLAGLAAWLFWRAESAKKADAQGEQMSAVIGDMQARRVTEAGKKADALIADGSPGYHAAGLFTKAVLATDKGDAKGAAAIYAGMVADEKMAQPFRDLALIRQTLLEYDSLKPQQVIDRLKPLAVEDNAYFGTAGEMTAIAMIQLNRGAEAGRLLATIARNKDTPASLRARAGRLASSLGADVGPNPADKD